MSGFRRTDPAQPNLIDGTIFATDTRFGGAYVTVKGPDETPLILSFDREDFEALRSMLDSYPIVGELGFTDFAPPAELLGNGRSLQVGIGSNRSGEYAYLGIGSEGRYGSVLLTARQVDRLIEELRVMREVFE